jgi:hypothetical protein
MVSRETVAYHKAGHAVVAWKVSVLGWRVTLDGVDETHRRLPLSLLSGCTPRPYAWARHDDQREFTAATRWARTEESRIAHLRKTLRRHVIVALAGPVAERRYLADAVTDAALDWSCHDRDQDYRDAVAFATGASDYSRDVHRVISEATAAAETIIGDPTYWRAVQRVAEVLLDHGMLSRAAISDTITKAIALEHGTPRVRLSPIHSTQPSHDDESDQLSG